jgi:uncharacterized protein with NRDE domain
VVAGLDHRGGGSWLGLNDAGLVAVVMNREGSLGPAPGKRSRGELVLEALDHSEASAAVRALADIDPVAYRSFNLFVGDPVSAYWVRHQDGAGHSAVEVHEVPHGVHMLSARELDDESLARVRTFLPQFREAVAPSPGAGDWTEWQRLLGVRAYSEIDGPYAAMSLDLPNGFRTLSSHLIAIPRYPAQVAPVFLHAEGPPDRAPFVPVAL